MEKQKAIKSLEKILLLADKEDREENLENFIKNPDEDTKDWFVFVPKFFNGALDICLTERVYKDKSKPKKSKGEKRIVWTQGARFFFDTGDTLYNSKDGYLDWNSALQKISFCIQIREAIGSSPIVINKEKKIVEPRNPGYVLFSIFTPNKEKTKIIEQYNFSLTQDEFVKFLIDGPTEKMRESQEWKALNLEFKDQNQNHT